MKYEMRIYHLNASPEIVPAYRWLWANKLWAWLYVSVNPWSEVWIKEID